MARSLKSFLKSSPTRGGDDVVYQGIDYRLERGANYNADCHVKHVAVHGEFTEFLQKFFHLYISCRYDLYFKENNSILQRKSKHLQQWRAFTSRFRPAEICA